MYLSNKLFKRFLSLAIASVVLCSTIPAQAAPAGDGTENNQNNVSTPAEEWDYTPEEPISTFDIARTVSAAAIDESEDDSSESSADIVKVHVTATDRNTGETVSVAGADVNLYVGSTYISTTASDSNGIAEVSLAGLSISQRQNATVSASKIVSRGKAIEGDGRDALFRNFPTEEDGEYHRYTMELHSETIDENGNWCGADIPISYESNKVDIVFAIDATGSMSDEINNVKNNIASFSENLIASGLDIRFCIIEYRDITESEETRVHTLSGSHWMTDIDSVVSELKSISATGGGDTPETVMDALGYVADNSLMSWRSDAYRFAFVLTDANCKTDNNYGYSSLSELAAKLAEMDVVTSVITSSDYQSAYSELYETTGGIYTDINSGTFDEEMLALSDSIIESVIREMTLTISEPRMLVNMSVCYFADDPASQDDSYREYVKNMLNEYSHRLAETSDGHVMLDKILLFSTDNRLNFYDTGNVASMADIQLQSEVKDDGTLWWNVKIHNNAYPFGFFSDDTITVNSDYMSAFKNLKDSKSYIGRSTFVRILSGGIDINKYSMIDNVYQFSATQAHETGHYLMGFFDEYMNANAQNWRDVGGKPYSEFGLMDNQYNDLEISKASIDYRYISPGSPLTYHWSVYGQSCEDTLADLLSLGTTPSYNGSNNEFTKSDGTTGAFYHFNLPSDGIFDDEGNDAEYDQYVISYSKAGARDRTAGYSYAELSESDFLSLRTDTGSRSAVLSDTTSGTLPAGSSYTQDSAAAVDFTENDDNMIISITAEDGCTYSVALLKPGDEDYTIVELVDNKAELDIARGELAEVRVSADNGETAQYNTYYIDRSKNTSTGCIYNSADNAVMAYVDTDEESSYTFIADNTGYTNGDYFSVNQATRISSDNGAVFDNGEIYSVASYLAEIDYTTLSWFKYADGEWTALATDYYEEENMNIGARADLDGEGLYVLMAQKAPSGEAGSAENLSYTQSSDLDAVVTLSFDDPNTNSKYYNVYYSENEFTDKNAEDVVVNSFNADSTDLTINLLERDRKVYAAVEIILEDGSRSELSEIILIGGEADSDGDGIPDWYCDKYLLWGQEGEDKNIADSDDDNDGLTNLEEYQGGSDPTDPNDPVHTTNVPVESISVSETDVTLSIGRTVKVTATVMPENATDKNVSWSSADTAIASIEASDGECIITAVGAGETQIYAVTADGGYSATINVTVENSAGDETGDESGKEPGDEPGKEHGEKHTGGTATCHTRAVCEICGEEYGDYDLTNHDGETELRNAAAAASTSEGYTGDLYCLGCETVIEYGEVIPKLTGCSGHFEVELTDGTLELHMDGNIVGSFTFTRSGNKWYIQDADGKYLKLNNNELKTSEDAFAWTYSNGMFSTKISAKTRFLFFWSRFTTYYLSYESGELTVSTSADHSTASFYADIDNEEHTYGDWTSTEGTHERTCIYCGYTENGICEYDESSHECVVCGSGDPGFASVDVSVTVTKQKRWFFWFPSYYKVQITATGHGTEVEKVEYSTDNKTWKSGTSFTSKSEVTKLYICVTDTNGTSYNWLYDDGVVTEK